VIFYWVKTRIFADDLQPGFNIDIEHLCNPQQSGKKLVPCRCGMGISHPCEGWIKNRGNSEFSRFSEILQPVGAQGSNAALPWCQV